jgi:hypothetical protein
VSAGGTGHVVGGLKWVLPGQYGVPGVETRSWWGETDPGGSIRGAGEVRRVAGGPKWVLVG